MKTKQKLISALLALSMLLSSGISVFAKTTTDDVMFDLKSLGIMVGNDDGDMQLDKPITRAEFATITVRLLSMQQAADALTGPSHFSDVSDDHWAKKSIELLSTLNIVAGTSETTFSPDDNVSMAAVAKILVNALGYNIAAENKGGYPSGYLSQAGTLGLLNGVDTKADPFTRGEVARMVYNALDVDIMSITYAGNAPKYEVKKGDTLRTRIKKGPNQSTGMEKLTGIVTATQDAYLDSYRPNMEQTDIEIDGALYRISDPTYLQYIGQSVDFYVDEEGSNVIVSMMPNDDNTTSGTGIHEIKDVTDTKITYYKDKENTSTDSIKYDYRTTLLKNNRVVSVWDKNTINALKSGTLTFIDNDDDGIVNVIFAREYESVLVDSAVAGESMIYLQNGYTLLGQKYINLDEDDNPGRRIKLVNKDNTGADLADLEKDDVLSALVSEDQSYVELVVSQKTFTGKLTAIDEDTVSIDDETYDLEKEGTGSLYNGENGYQVKVYLNFNNEVVTLQRSTSSESYAYVTKIFTEDGGDVRKVRLLIPDVLTEEKEEVDKEDSGEKDTISKIVSKNKQVLNLPLADKVSLDGGRVSSADIGQYVLNQVVIYHTNSDGEVYKFSFPEQIGTGTEKYYNSYERTFGKTNGGAFGISMDTKTICIPKDDPNPSTDDYLTTVEMNNGQLYTVRGYDRNDTGHTADLIVVTMTMKSGTAGLINTKSKVGVVNRAYTAVDDDDENVVKIDLLTEGKVTTYKLADVVTDSDSYSRIIKGELIAYSLNSDDEIDAYRSLGILDRNMTLGLENNRGDYETFTGYLTDIQFDEVSEDLNRWVHQLYCGFSEDGPVERIYEVTRSGGAPIFIFDASTRVTRVGDLREINVGSDLVYICASNNTVRAVVAIKN